MIFDPFASRGCQAVIISRESCHCCRWSCLSGPLPWLKSRLLIFSTININKVKKFWKIFTLLTWESYKILQRTNRSTPAMQVKLSFFEKSRTAPNSNLVHFGGKNNISMICPNFYHPQIIKGWNRFGGKNNISSSWPVFIAPILRFGGKNSMGWCQDDFCTPIHSYPRG